jgi:hypothetical protein
MRCHIIVSLESIECVESHGWPNKNAGAKLREHGVSKKDRPIAATLKRKLLTKGKRVGWREHIVSRLRERDVVEWAKRSVPTILSRQENGGHGAVRLCPLYDSIPA